MFKFLQEIDDLSYEMKWFLFSMFFCWSLFAFIFLAAANGFIPGINDAHQSQHAICTEASKMNPKTSTLKVLK